MNRLDRLLLCSIMLNVNGLILNSSILACSLKAYEANLNKLILWMKTIVIPRFIPGASTAQS